MLIDILYCIIIVLALWKGYRQGLILGLFSMVAIFIGLAAAIKLSVIAAAYLERSGKISGPWLPVVSFIIVFIAVLILVWLAAKAIESSIKLVMLGWLNRLGGMVCFAIIYTLVFGIFLFYAEKMKWFGPETIRESRLYEYIAPWGPRAIDWLGQLLPWFKDMFNKLEDFFGNLAHQLPQG